MNYLYQFTLFSIIYEEEEEKESKNIKKKNQKNNENKIKIGYSLNKKDKNFLKNKKNLIKSN